MPLTELARLTLTHSLCPAALPESFFVTWRKALSACTKASGIPFQLWQDERDPTSIYLLGGWRTEGDHATFLATKEALALSKAIGKWAGLERVQHIDLDIETVRRDAKRLLQIETFEVDGDLIGEWEAGLDKPWTTVMLPSGETWPRGDYVGGWDVSEKAQGEKNEKVFKDMRNAVGGPAEEQTAASESGSGSGSGSSASKKTWMKFSYDGQGGSLDTQKAVDEMPADPGPFRTAKPVPAKSVKVRLML